MSEELQMSEELEQPFVTNPEVSVEDPTGDAPSDGDGQPAAEDPGPPPESVAADAASDEEQPPGVIDLNALLRPIPGENPSGENLRYSGLYDEISDARRADDNLNQGEWQTELKVADFRRVIDIVVPALTNQSKDLQLAAWLSEALIK